MNLKLLRTDFGETYTIGEFSVNSLFESYMLEDKDRKLEDGGVKVAKETAIPRGRYRVIIDWSDRFRCLMLHILDVPQFEGIRIHAGNKVGDTEGCLLPGQQKGHDTVLNSVPALKSISLQVLGALIDGQDVWIEVA